MTTIQIPKGPKVQKLIDNFCKTWKIRNSEEFYESFIELFTDVEKQFFLNRLKYFSINDEKNLHSEYKSVKKDLSKILETLNAREEELKKVTEQLSAKKKTRSSSGSSLGKFASKVAKDYAEENGVDESQIDEGSGKDGKITKKDIQNFIGVKKGTSAKKKQLCSGVKNNGEACKLTGKKLINGSWYCSKHENQGAQVELDEDHESEDDEDVEKQMEKYRNESLKSEDNPDCLKELNPDTLELSKSECLKELNPDSLETPNVSKEKDFNLPKELDLEEESDDEGENDDEQSENDDEQDENDFE